MAVKFGRISFPAPLAKRPYSQATMHGKTKTRCFSEKMASFVLTLWGKRRRPRKWSVMVPCIENLLYPKALRSLLAMGIWLFSMGCAKAFCFAEAAARYQVNENILQAIAQHESNMNPSLVMRTANGRSDIGLMGINTVHFEPTERLYRAGFTPTMMLDPCMNVMTGAYLLRLKMDRFGNTWQAVGAYHSTTDVYSARYQVKIWETLRQILARNSAVK
jgi:Transglycosylase SLT domain